MAELVRRPWTLHSRVVTRLRRLSVVLLVLALLFAITSAVTGCRKKGDTPTEVTPEFPVLNDTTAGLLLTWIDDKGEFHVEQRASDVPEAGRDIVKVRDPARDPISGGRVFIVDLRSPGPGGGYVVRMVESGEFEDVAVTRRAKHGVVLAPRAAGSAPSGEGAADVARRPAVIIYGASWCGPCHQAAAYLKQRGVAFVEHDIEKDSAAAREMQGKLAKAGRQGGSIPVLDVRGRILIGFDQRAVDQALGRAL